MKNKTEKEYLIFAKFLVAIASLIAIFYVIGVNVFSAMAVDFIFFVLGFSLLREDLAFERKTIKQLIPVFSDRGHDVSALPDLVDTIDFVYSIVIDAMFLMVIVVSLFWKPSDLSEPIGVVYIVNFIVYAIIFARYIFPMVSETHSAHEIRTSIEKKLMKDERE